MHHLEGEPPREPKNMPHLPAGGEEFLRLGGRRALRE